MEYGLDRLKAVVAKSEPAATRLGETVLADVKEFTGGFEVQDDRVIVCFSRDAGADG